LGLDSRRLKLGLVSCDVETMRIKSAVRKELDETERLRDR